MRSSFLSTAAVLAATFYSVVVALDPTDEYRDADVAQSGYLPNHNMDPAIVNSPQFGQLWKVPFNKAEQFYAKPLTYTPLAGANAGNQLLFLASSQNYIRILDAKTGTIINSRQVHTPFLQSDIGCTDIPGTIGITGTPIIDPATDTAYFFAKTYIANLRVAGATGTSNGVYYFHGVNVNTLQDVFPPILIDGSPAQNDARRIFAGGVILQRPSLTQIGSVVYGAFGGHCDLFNYTGVVMGVDVNLQKIVTQYAMESGPLVTPTDVLLQNGGGGQAGIWMSGMGIASDGQRIFFVTANGDGHQNQGAPAAGSSHLQTLGEAAVNMGVDGSGVLSLSDYFQPYDYQNMDAADQDFGSGGIVLLDPSVFKGTGVNKMAVTAGKNGKVYILNADNLGGYKLGTGQTDGVLQTIVTNKAVFGASASYPLEGGYIYLTPVGYQTYCYQLGFTSAGVPIFSLVGQTNEISTGRVGVGIPVVTTFNGNPGTAILWMTDPDAGIRAWYAVPQNGVLKNIPLPQIGGANKFQRPAFGNGRVYTTDSNGILYCLGAPVALPLNCTSPINFGQLAMGQTKTMSITCKANIAITSLGGMTVAENRFVVSNTSLPTGSLAAGASFTFPVTWDLTSAIVQNNPSGSYGSVTPGIKSTPLTIYTTNAVVGYSTLFPISLTGTEVSGTAFLEVAPQTVDYGGIVILDPNNVPTISSPFTITNAGQASMQILGYAYTYNIGGIPKYVNATQTNGVWDLGLGFTSTALPALNSIIGPNAAVTLQSTFNPTNGTGAYASFFQIWSTGGTVDIVLEGSASTAPVANISISNGEGGWNFFGTSLNIPMNFGNVAPGSSSSQQVRICNSGGSVLSIDKSKPPNGVFHISDPTELHESQQIPVNSCAFGTVLMVANTEEYDLPDLQLNNSWTLNTNDLNFGVHLVQITGTVVDTKVGPVNSTGQTVYSYLGCFKESNSGPRLFPNEPVSPSQNNSNSFCQSTCFGAKGYAFAGTEFGTECWCGNTPPPVANQDTLDVYCNFACPADGNDRCGGTGYLSVFYDPTKYTAGADPSLYGPQTVKVAGNYNYLGCYTEGTGSRALTGLAPKAPTAGFTIELCQAACQGYTYFGMEFSNQCYCGNTINGGASNQTSSVPSTNGCSMLCTGNQNEYCGGAGRLNMYQINGSAPIPTTRSSVTSTTTTATGTVSTTTASSATTTTTASSATTTTTASTATTSTTASSATTTTTASTATSTAASNATTTTSTVPTPTGPYTVQSLRGWNYYGCWTESTTGRALAALQNPAAAVPVSVESCALACAAYSYFGVEYAGECYCGNSFSAGAAIAPGGSVPSANGCNLVCKGNSSEYCGGSKRLNVYQAVALSASTSSSSSTSTISSTSTSSSSVSSSSSSSSVSSSSSTMSTTSSSSSSTASTSSSSSASTTSPSLSSSSLSSSTTTSSSSSLTATSSSISTTSSTSSASTITSSSTSGSSSSSTSTTSSTSTSTSSSSTTSTSITGTTTTATASSTTWVPVPGQTTNSWAYLGCANETNPRALNSASYANSTAMTVESCQAFCNKNNYGLAGLENSRECYCGNALQQYSAVGYTGCNTLCSGSSYEYCGGTSRISLFSLTTFVPPSTVQVANNYVYQGCYHEPATGRLLSGPAYTNSTGMTVESCVNFCAAKSPQQTYAGVEYSQECYCGTTLPIGSTRLLDASCGMMCKGNAKEFCGGSGLLDVYMFNPAAASTMTSAPAKTARAVPVRRDF